MGLCSGITIIYYYNVDNISHHHYNPTWTGQLSPNAAQCCEEQHHPHGGGRHVVPAVYKKKNTSLLIMETDFCS